MEPTTQSTAAAQTVVDPTRKVWHRPPAICYVSTWEAGLKILALYHAGMYKAGIEDLIDGGSPIPIPETKDVLCQYCQTVLEDIERIKKGEKPVFSTTNNSTEKGAPTFKEVYEAFHSYKYGPHANKKLKKSTQNSTNAAYERFAPFYNRSLDSITVDELQNLINKTADAGRSKSTVSRMVTLCHQMYRYAYPRDLCSRETGRYVELPACKEEEHHQDFTDEELEKLWQHKDDPIVKNILVMCYSGYRVNEYTSDNFSVNMDELYFQGGFKTDAGKDRIVPIHSGIRELVRSMDGVFFCGMTTDLFRDRMKEKLVEIGIDGVTVDGIERYHTPHSCRHTFSRLCESFSVNEADRKRMMGHSLRNDVTNGVYGHRTVAELRRELEKIIVREY